MFYPMSKRGHRILADYPLQPPHVDPGARVATSVRDRSAGGPCAVFAAKQQTAEKAESAGVSLRTARPTQMEEASIKLRHERKKHER
jgi:hypothetical protein